MAAMLVLLALSIPCIAIADAGARLLSLEDRALLRSPGAPVIAPDERRLAVSLDDEVYIVDVRRGHVRALDSGGSASDPAWSGDGRTLWFLSNRSGTSQLWAVDTKAFSDPRQLTELDTGVAELNLSPDGGRLVLSLSANDLAEDSDAEPEPLVVTRMEFKEDDGHGYVTDADIDQLYVLNIGSVNLVQLTDADRSATEPSWSPDGKSVAFVRDAQAIAGKTYARDIWVVDADDPARVRRLTESATAKWSPRWSPDGEHVAFIDAGDGVYSVQHLAIVPATGGEPRILTASLDRWVSDFRYSADGAWIYFIYDDGGGMYLARVSVGDGTIDGVITGHRVVTGFDVAASGRVAAVMSEENRPPELYEAHNEKLRRLSAFNDEFLATVLRGSKTAAYFTSTDDTRVQTFITLPPNAVEGTRYPAILHIHGGPVLQFDWAYDFFAQYLAAHGYVVIEPNPRGSSGRGEAFIRPIYRNWGITDYPDVIGAVDKAIDLGLADPDRLAVTGYSYGGYMTNVVITRTDRFKAAASGAGHSYIAANFGHDIYQAWYTWELGSPWQNRDAYDRLSPLLDAGKVTTPTLFLGGAVDWNVPILNAELFYQALRIRGIDTQLVVYPGVHHGDWPASYDDDYLARIVGWFDRYLAASTTTSASTAR